MRLAIVEDTPGDYQTLRTCIDPYVRAHELNAWGEWVSHKDEGESW